MDNIIAFVTKNPEIARDIIASIMDLLVNEIKAGDTALVPDLFKVAQYEVKWQDFVKGRPGLTRKLLLVLIDKLPFTVITGLL